MKLKFSLFFAFTLMLTGSVIFESYWRSKGYYPNLNNDKALWSMERSKVDKASNEDVIKLLIEDAILPDSRK